MTALLDRHTQADTTPYLAMESPTRASLRSEYNHHHQPAQSSPLRAVFAPVVARTSVGSSGRARKSNTKRASTRDQDMGTPFALTIPPLPPSSITASRSMKSTPRPRNDVNDENTPVAFTLNATRNDRQTAVTSVKRLNTIPAGDQTMFAPMLLSVGDQSLLMEQQLPTYKDLWNDSEDEGEDELSFMVDSMEQENGVYDGSVRSRGKDVRKSILGQSTLQNHAPGPLSTTKASKGQTNPSKLASLYKPTPKPDTSSRRRSTLFARGYASGDKLVEVSDGMHDVMVPLYGASSPMAVGSESTPMALSRREATEKQRIVQSTRGSDTEEDDGDGEVGITDEQIAERPGRQSGSQIVSRGSQILTDSEQTLCDTVSVSSLARLCLSGNSRGDSGGNTTYTNSHTNVDRQTELSCKPAVSYAKVVDKCLKETNAIAKT